MILIRQAKLSDIDEIVCLWHELMNFHIKLDSFFELCEDAEDNFRNFLVQNISIEEKAIVFIAENKENNKNLNKTVGYIMGFESQNPPVFKTTKFGLICDICVHPKYRRQEIGEKLFEAIKEWFFSKDLSQIQIEVSVRNPISMPFWKKLGFTPLLQKMYLNKE